MPAFGQALAVGGERGPGRREAQRGVEQQQAPLDQRHVHHSTPSGLPHRRQQRSLQASRGQQVQHEFGVPVFVGQGGAATGTPTGAAQRVYQNVQDIEPFQLHDHGRTFGRGDVRGHEPVVGCPRGAVRAVPRTSATARAERRSPRRRRGSRR
jgi:hypothetical protein